MAKTKKKKENKVFLYSWDGHVADKVYYTRTNAFKYAAQHTRHYPNITVLIHEIDLDNHTLIMWMRAGEEFVALTEEAKLLYGG